MTGQPFTLLVDIPLKPGRADEFMALLNDVFEAMKVEETFVSATALRGAEDPDTILLCENWIDRENFMSVQLKHPYRDWYEARLPELLRIGRRVGADPISFGARFGANDRTLPWLRAADSISRQ